MNYPVDIEIVEVVDDGTGGYKTWEDITDAIPGMTYSVIPRVKNNGSMPVRVQMCLSESAMNMLGELLNLPSNTFWIDIDDHWSLTTGDCYVYNTELESEAVTEPIFYEVTLSSALGNEYQNSTFNLHLETMAIGGVPERPETGIVSSTASLSKTDILLYLLSVTALIVLFIHVARYFWRKRRKGKLEI